MSLVTVQDQTFMDHFSLCGLFEGVGHQAHRVVLVKLVGDDKAVVQVLDGGKVSPARRSAYTRP